MRSEISILYIVPQQCRIDAAHGGYIIHKSAKYAKSEKQTVSPLHSPVGDVPFPPPPSAQLNDLDPTPFQHLADHPISRILNPIATHTTSPRITAPMPAVEIPPTRPSATLSGLPARAKLCAKPAPTIILSTNTPASPSPSPDRNSCRPAHPPPPARRPAPPAPSPGSSTRGSSGPPAARRSRSSPAPGSDW